MTMPEAVADHPRSPLSSRRPSSESRVFSIVLSSSQLSCFCIFFTCFPHHSPHIIDSSGSSSPSPRPNTIPFRSTFQPRFPHLCCYDPPLTSHPPTLPIHHPDSKLRRQPFPSIAILHIYISLLRNHALPSSPPLLIRLPGSIYITRRI